MGTHQIRYHRCFPFGGIVSPEFVGATSQYRRGAEYGDGGIGYDPETMATSQPVSDTNRCSTASGGQVL
jgi:hypothetical protein